MKKFKIKNIYIVIFLIACVVGILAFYFVHSLLDMNESVDSVEKFRSYHVMVVGKYDNQLFMEQVFNGAQTLGEKYDAVVELYVPNSKAEDKTLEELFDYSGLLNVDGIIAYIDSEEELTISPCRTDGSQIPVVTTGMYMTTIGQISYIGTSWFEVGKRIADEAGLYLKNKEQVQACIIGNNSQNNPNYSSLMNSLQRELKSRVGIDYTEVQELTPSYLFDQITSQESPVLIISVTEAETLKAAQVIADLGFGDKTYFVGYGNSEPLMLYFNNGVIDELVCVDPQNIGETAMGQLNEYRIKGYANSYVAADIKVIKGDEK